MRRRLMTTIIMALVAAAVAPYFSANWDMAPLVVMGVSAVVGAILGYVASMLFDVFTSDFGNTSDLHSPE